MLYLSKILKTVFMVVNRGNDTTSIAITIFIRDTQCLPYLGLVSRIKGLITYNI